MRVNENAHRYRFIWTDVDVVPYATRRTRYDDRAMRHPGPASTRTEAAADRSSAEDIQRDRAGAPPALGSLDHSSGYARVLWRSCFDDVKD